MARWYTDFWFPRKYCFVNDNLSNFFKELSGGSTSNSGGSNWNRKNTPNTGSSASFGNNRRGNTNNNDDGGGAAGAKTRKCGVCGQAGNFSI
jgi:hypothetical protein